MNDPRSERRATAAAIALLVLLPLGLLFPAVFGGNLFVPYDLAGYPPASLQLDSQQLAEVRKDSNLDVTEVPIWFLPEMAMARQELVDHGRFPGWNPYARTGTAMHGYGLLGLLYPPNWLMFLDRDPAPLLAWVVWLDLALAGLLAFGLFRHLGIGIVPALFGAAVFQLSGAMAANAPFWMRLGSLVWLPGALWAQLCLADARRALPWRPVAGLAVCIAMPWLSGFPPYALAATLLAMLFGVVLTLQRFRERDRSAALRLGGALALGGGLGVILALPAVLPSLLFFAAGARPQPTMAMLAADKFDWYGLLGLLLPDLFGHPTAGAQLPYDKSPLCLWLATVAPGTGRPSNYNYTEYSLYLGTSSLFAVGYGAVRGQGRLRWFAVLAAVLVLGLGTFAPGFRLAFLLPGMANIFPMRMLTPALLLLAWLAALGVERLLQPHRHGLRVGLVLLAVTALLAWYLGSDLQPRADGAPALFQRWLPDAMAAKYNLPAVEVRQFVDAGSGLDRFLLAQQRLADELLRLARWALLAALWCGGLLLAQRRGHRGTPSGWLLVAMVTVQLWTHGAGLDRGHACTTPVWTPVHQFLQDQQQAAQNHGGFMVARASRTVPSLPTQLPPGELLPARIRDLHYDSHYDRWSHQPLLALFGRDIAAKTYLTSALPDDARLQSPLLDLLGVRYLLATTPLQHAGELRGPGFSGPGGTFYVYERPHPLPRAFVAPALRPVDDDGEAVQALVDPAFQPAACAVVTPAELAVLQPFTASPAARAVTFVVDDPGEVVLHVAAGTGGCLVLADTWMPGWSAWIDAEPRPIARVDHSLRGLSLPDRACTVRFAYTPPGLRAGMSAAVLALLALFGLYLGERRSRRDRAPSDSGM